MRSILSLMEALPAFAPHTTEVTRLKQSAESCSRQLRACADSLQNSPIRGPRYLTQTTTRDAADRKRAEAFEEHLRNALPENHPLKNRPSPQSRLTPNLSNLKSKISNFRSQISNLKLPFVARRARRG